ncbi:MAG: ABC transporter permease [Planctomycetaceae bacterium]
MSVSRLIVSEIAHRKGSFFVALLSVAVAVGCLVGALTLLKADELETRRIVEAKEREVAQAVERKQREVEQAGASLEDAYRKITLGLGFNIYILPEKQDVREFRVGGRVTETMPEEYVTRLAESDIMTINHLLPMVLEKLEWPEIGEEVILIGTRGEVPAHERAAKKPLQEQVPPGTMIVGHGLHQKHGIDKGDAVKFQGREFTIHEVYPERQTADDFTVWIHLRDAQEMLGRENLINLIQALECNCATVDRLGEIRADIAKVLPGTQVEEMGDKALARAEARNRAQAEALAALEREQRNGDAEIAREKEGRAAVQNQREAFAAVLVPLVLIGAAAWIGFLALANVRQRASEIGILRAIGFRSAQILAIFLGKALLVGLLGAAIGYAAGFAIALFWGDPPGGAEAVFTLQWLLLAILVAPILSVIASWIPALMAARQDPAVVLQGE